MNGEDWHQAELHVTGRLLGNFQWIFGGAAAVLAAAASGSAFSRWSQVARVLAPVSAGSAAIVTALRPGDISSAALSSPLLVLNKLQNEARNLWEFNSRILTLMRKLQERVAGSAAQSKTVEGSPRVPRRLFRVTDIRYGRKRMYSFRSHTKLTTVSPRHEVLRGVRSRFAAGCWRPAGSACGQRARDHQSVPYAARIARVGRLGQALQQARELPGYGPGVLAELVYRRRIGGDSSAGVVHPPAASSASQRSRSPGWHLSTSQSAASVAKRTALARPSTWYRQVGGRDPYAYPRGRPRTSSAWPASRRCRRRSASDHLVQLGLHLRRFDVARDGLASSIRSTSTISATPRMATPIPPP